MQRPIKVDSPFATPYDVARILGVSKSRIEEIRKRVRRMLHRDAATGEITVVRAKRKATGTFTQKNGGRHATTQAKKTKSKRAKA
jgi:hypothetical protein